MEKDLLAYAYTLIARRAYTRAEMARKLREKGKPEDAETVLEQITESGYLNDLDFARNYIQQRSAGRPSGSRLLEMKLRSKGIPIGTIKEALSEIEPETEEALAQKLAEKKATTLKNLEPPIRKRKLFQFLLSRGFSFKLAEKFSSL